MFSKFGGWGPSEASDRSTKASSSGRPSSVLCARSKPMVVAIFRSMPGPPQSDPPRWPGQTSTSSGERQELLVHRAEDAARAVLLLDREIRAGDVADEQRVAGQHRPGIVAAGGVDQRVGGVLRAVTGRVERAHDDPPQLELPAVLDRLVFIFRASLAVDVDAGAGRHGEAAMARDVIGVGVRLEHVLDVHAEIAREAQVDGDVEPRVDDGGHARVLVADQVGGAAEVVVGDLTEDHPRDTNGLLSPRRPPTGAP